MTAIPSARMENAETFSEGLAAVCINGRYGYIDRRGEMAIAPQFSDAMYFVHKLAMVAAADGTQWGYIDRKGNFVYTMED